jgi:hypothetical protein
MQIIVPLIVIIAAIALRQGLNINLGGSNNTSLDTVNLSAYNHSIEIPYLGNAETLPLYSSPMYYIHFSFTHFPDGLGTTLIHKSKL